MSTVSNRWRVDSGLPDELANSLSIFVLDLSGRQARRFYAAVLLLTLCLTATARLHSYLIARKIQAVLRGLAEIRVGQTTEEQLMRTMPYLKRSDRDWKVGDSVEHWRYTEISNESDWFAPQVIMYGSWCASSASRQQCRLATKKRTRKPAAPHSGPKGALQLRSFSTPTPDSINCAFTVND